MFNEKNDANLVEEEVVIEGAIETPHDLNIKTRSIVKECEALGIPIFISYFLPGKGFKHKAVLPEEVNVDDEEVKIKFKRFLQAVINYDKEDYFPTFNSKKED